MQTLTYTIGKDRRALVKDIQNFTIDFNDQGVKNWVQARQYERSMRQVFVNVNNDDDNPFNLTGCNIWFEGVLPDKTHKILDAKHAVILDAQNGQFRFDMPAQAFAVAGSYVQAFFRIVRDGQSITTLEFDLEVLADKVISGLIPSDYITPFEDLYDQLEQIVKNADDKLQDKLNEWNQKLQNLFDTLNKMGTDTQTLLQTLQNRIADLEEKIKQDNLVTQPQLDSFKQSIKSEIDKQNAILDGMTAKWHDIEVVDYKPTRDGKAHTLSESYASVDEAQKDYPAATSLADTKDWCAITEAIQKGQQEGQNVYVAPGHYVVNKTITLPTDVKFYGAYQNSKIYASQQMCEDSKKNPIAILEYDDEGQPPLYIENIHVLGNSDTSNQIVGLHVGGNRASRIVNLIVSNAYGHGTWIHATNEKSADVENMTFEHYWQVQSGSFRIESNANIDRGNITDFAVNDSQITSLDIRDDNQTNQSMPAVEIINDDSASAVKTIYGISFARCFLHAQANNLVRIVGNHAPRATHSINFDFIKGELHDEHGGFSSLCDKYFLFHLESCWHVMIDRSTQLFYSGASYVEMKNAAFCDIKTAGILYLSWMHSDSKIFTMDELCYENHINLVGEDLFLSPGGTAFEKNPNLGYDYGNAVDAMDLFDKMVDKGADNHISGYQIAQTLTLNNEPHRLRDIDESGKINGLMEAWQKGVTSSVEDNTVYSKHVFAKGVVNEMLMLPLLYKRTSGFLVSIRAIGNETDLKKMKVLVGSNFYNMPTDQGFHRWTGICPTSSLNAIGIQVFGENVTLDNDVTVEIEYLDAFMENKIPYYPDFIALPAPKVGEVNY